MFTLTYPIASPTLTLILKDPDFGDVLRVEHGAIVRATRSDELKSFRDATWQNIETTAYQFVTLTEAKVDELKTFLKTSAGLEVAIATDHLGNTWHGIIISIVTDIVRRLDTCAYDVTLEFRGTKQ